MRITLLLTAALLSTSAFAYKYVGPEGPGANNSNDIVSAEPATRAAACAPATALRDLEWNNVRALIETGGSMWQNRATSQASYEVPKGGGVSSLYAGALWMVVSALTNS